MAEDAKLEADGHPDTVLPYAAARRQDGPSRAQRTTATLVGLLLGFGVCLVCAGAWWLQALQLAPPSVPPEPFDWHRPAIGTLIGLAILTTASWIPIRARRDLRVAILTGGGLVLLLQGLCFLK